MILLSFVVLTLSFLIWLFAGDSYADAKARIFSNQSAADWAVLSIKLERWAAGLGAGRTRVPEN